MREFEERFGRAAEVETSAPGRVNLIGEHTDYNGGFVLPAALPCGTRVALTARADREVRVASLDLGEGIARYVLGSESRRGDWVDYVQAVTAALAAEGIAVQGFDACVSSDLPIGAGLSSSAALSVALLRALRRRFGLDLDDVHVARLAQRAENEFVGARVGVMDPMVASLGREGHALFLDTRDLARRDVPVPPSLELVVVDSGVRHQVAGGEYNRRREECERAAERLGVRQLRDLHAPDLARVDALPEPLRRRARHVITENDRVLEAVRALEEDDPERLGALLRAAHNSLRDDFEVSTPDIERLVSALDAEMGVLGARLTGAGFGGSVVALARAGTGRAAARGACEAYDAGGAPRGRVVLPCAREPVAAATGTARDR